MEFIMTFFKNLFKSFRKDKDIAVSSSKEEKEVKILLKV